MAIHHSIYPSCKNSKKINTSQTTYTKANHWATTTFLYSKEKLSIESYPILIVYSYLKLLGFGFCVRNNFGNSVREGELNMHFGLVFCRSQNKDNSDLVVNSSKNFIPLYEFPFLFSFGLQTAMAYWSGCIAIIPPPTPLLPGSPTLNANSPDSS